MFGAAGFGIVGAENDAGETGMGDGAGAHGAGFERDVERAVFEVFFAALREGALEGDELGMLGGIAAGFDFVMGGGDELAACIDDHGADGDFAEAGAGTGEGEGVLHGFHGTSVAEKGVSVIISS